MADLNKNKSYVNITGKVKIKENTFSGVQTSEKTGYKYTRINLGIDIGNQNVIYTEMMGGYQPNNPIIYAMSKEDNQGFQVNWADRLNEKIVETVADFRLHKVGLKRDEEGKLIIKNFLSPIDVADYLKENLTDGMEVTIRGSFSFSEFNGETKRKIDIQSIFLPYQQKEKDEQGNDTGNLLPVQYGATFTQSILLTEDSYKRLKKADKDAGEIIIPAKAVDYVSKKDGKSIKKNLPFAVPITVKVNQENPEMTEKILGALFDVKKGKIRELTIEGTIIEGYDQQEISDKDIELSAEVQELIAMGLYSEEEAKSKMTVRGSKVSKLVFTRPFLQKDRDDATKLKLDMSDDKYTPEDLFVQIEEEKKEDSLTDDLTETQVGGEAGDTAWMGALGIG